MGSLSVSNHRGFVHLQGLLLVVSLLTFWSQPTTAKLTVESVDALEGTNVTLRISYKTRRVSVILWYRGEIIDSHYNIAYLLLDPGNHVRGPPGAEEIVEDDGSLTLKNVTMKHSGIYTVLLQLEGCHQIITCGRLDVYRPVSMPKLLASNTIVTENKDAVVLTCYTNADIIEWFYNGSSLRYSQTMKLSLDRRNLTIDPVMRGDAGDYQCKGSNPISLAGSNLIKLEVKFE